jgi:heme oxygenase (biliverdin-IX-beta and delta-forming)
MDSNTTATVADTQAPDVLSALKTRTQVYHRDIETVVNLMDPEMTLAEYGQLLQIFHGFYSPMEAAAAANFEAETLARFNFENRRKTAWLRSDLQALGLEPDTTHQAELPPLETYPQVLGAFYVMEGATLGGQHIARQVAQKFGVTPEKGCAFFSSYQEKRMPMWQAYQAALVACDEPDALVDAACEAFRCFNAWCKSNKESKSQ